MTDIRLDPWFFPYFKEPVESEAQYSTSMQDKYKEIFTQLYMCSPDEFDALYDQLVDEFMTMYGNEVCAERAEVWANTME
jgi:putative aldouronate transport system substrate-binding protein